jgi:hypothetical protein
MTWPRSLQSVQLTMLALSLSWACTQAPATPPPVAGDTPADTGPSCLMIGAEHLGRGLLAAAGSSGCFFLSLPVHDGPALLRFAPACDMANVVTVTTIVASRRLSWRMDSLSTSASGDHVVLMDDSGSALRVDGRELSACGRCWRFMAVSRRGELAWSFALTPPADECALDVWAPHPAGGVVASVQCRRRSPWLVSIDSDGRVRWEQPLEAVGLAVAPSGKVVVSTPGGFLYLFTDAGTRLVSAPLAVPGLALLSWSEDGCLGFATERHVGAMSGDKLSPLWSREYSGQPGAVLAVSCDTVVDVRYLGGATCAADVHWSATAHDSRLGHTSVDLGPGPYAPVLLTRHEADAFATVLLSEIDGPRCGSDRCPRLPSDAASYRISLGEGRQACPDPAARPGFPLSRSSDQEAMPTQNAGFCRRLAPGWAPCARTAAWDMIAKKAMRATANIDDLSRACMPPGAQ